MTGLVPIPCNRQALVIFSDKFSVGTDPRWVFRYGFQENIATNGHQFKEESTLFSLATIYPVLLSYRIVINCFLNSIIVLFIYS